MFTKRPSNQAIFFISEKSSGWESRNAVLPGDSVTLQVGDERVLAHNVALAAANQFKATVCDFKFGADTHEIEFNEAHIFGCHKCV